MHLKWSESDSVGTAQKIPQGGYRRRDLKRYSPAFGARSGVAPNILAPLYWRIRLSEMNPARPFALNYVDAAKQTS
jgi:hypothetical protein